jgi:AmiR/NasT family two-component response regulator
MTDLPRLRVLIADERREVLEALSDLVQAAGHEPVACVVGLTETATAAERHEPDVAVVGVHDDSGHALDLLGTIAAAGIPVVITLDEADEQFIAEAATRGVVAHARPVDQDAIATALRLAHTRGQALTRSLTERVREIQERMRDRALVERAKGILMERHDISEQEAYAMLRRHARDERRPMVSTAEALLRARPLLPRRPDRDEDTADS